MDKVIIPFRIIPIDVQPEPAQPQGLEIFNMDDDNGSQPNPS